MLIVDEPEALLGSTGYLLARVGMESRRSWGRMLVERGLTPHHYAVLMALDQRGAISQQELSRLVGIDPRNAVPVIDALERRDLIARGVDTADRRRHAVRLTPTGRTTLDELRQAGDQLEREFLSGLSASEQRTLHALLRKLLAGLGV
jgi:MarR family transcriptional regulator, lower aerobic nicotinate degradation pathway regulator